jgi:anthranilate synthase component II
VNIMTPSVFMLDNYDSFTYNLVQYLSELGAQVTTVRNDQITVDGVLALQPTHVVVSPGPCAPAQAGISVSLIQRCAGHVPVLGVCLGHQAIGEAFGGKVVRAQQLMHGKTDVIQTSQQGVFCDLPQSFTVTRYHSLAIERESLPEDLVVTAWTADGEIMAVKHKHLAVEGVQFHPESISTEYGHDLLKNFLALKC